MRDDVGRLPVQVDVVGLGGGHRHGDVAVTARPQHGAKTQQKPDGIGEMLEHLDALQARQRLEFRREDVGIERLERPAKAPAVDLVQREPSRERARVDSHAAQFRMGIERLHHVEAGAGAHFVEALVIVGRQQREKSLTVVHDLTVVMAPEKLGDEDPGQVHVHHVRFVLIDGPRGVLVAHVLISFRPVEQFLKPHRVDGELGIADHGLFVRLAVVAEQPEEVFVEVPFPLQTEQRLDVQKRLPEQRSLRKKRLSEQGQMRERHGALGVLVGNCTPAHGGPRRRRAEREALLVLPPGKNVLFALAPE